MKQLFLNLLVLIIIIPINDVRSQDEYMLQIIKEQLGKSDIKKIEKAEKYIVSANEQINEAKTLENSGKSNNKSLNKKIKASTELGDAHKIIYDVYLENVEKYAKISSSENAQKANKNIGDDYKLIKEAKKKRETSLRINVLENAYNVLEQACNLEKKAIVNLAETYILLSGKKTKIMNNDVVKSENEEPLNSKEKLTEDKSNKNEQVKIEENKTSEIENNKNIITNVKSSNEENKTSDVVTELNEQDIKGVFFKIQIAASKTPLSVEQLNSIYKTNEIFNVEKDGEWYKYTVVQKFATFDEALAYKEKLKVKGLFIIAYKNGKRVSVEEALKNDEVNSKVVANNTVTVENTRNIQVETVVYRLQIGISTMRMTDKEITEFKNAGKSVLTIDHGGWFSYNIGEFNSMQEAQKFKANARLVDATVVKFVNGKLIEE